MNNIFTFDLDDDQQIVQPNQNALNQQKKSTQNQKEENSNDQKNICFKFDQFQEEQSKQAQTKQIFRDITNSNNTKRKIKSTVQYRLKKQYQQSQNQDENIDDFQDTSKQNQKTSNLMAGLQVEDLGTNDMQYVNEKKALRVTDMRKFLNTPLGDYKVKAIIKKQSGAFLNLNSKYNVYIEQNNRYLFTISREGVTQYIFSLDKSSSERKKNYLGKMIGNMIGTEFLLFDSGFSPKQTRSLQYCRKQLASIKYSSSNGPRKFTVLVSTNCQGYYALQPQHNILQQKWEKKERDYISILHSKSPQFDPQDGNYKLDFKGVVKKASVKNFILGGTKWEDSLIFGKIQDNTFMMQIKEPLSVLQAAAICVSSIHYKLYWK